MTDHYGDDLTEEQYSGFSEPDYMCLPYVVQCSCGRGYSLAAWEELRLIDTMLDGEGGTLELRNCRCGSTRSRLLP